MHAVRRLRPSLRRPFGVSDRVVVKPQLIGLYMHHVPDYTSGHNVSLKLVEAEPFRSLKHYARRPAFHRHPLHTHPAQTPTRSQLSPQEPCR